VFMSDIGDSVSLVPRSLRPLVPLCPGQRRKSRGAPGTSWKSWPTSRTLWPAEKDRARYRRRVHL
jgi:hypothetical protein